MSIVPQEKLGKALADLLKDCVLFEPEVTHHFSDGVCVREMRVPAGSIVVGAMHTSKHLTMMMFGIMEIRIGNEVKVVQAPSTFEALKGSRKIGFAITDCVVSNVFPTDSKDIEEIERMFTNLHEDDFIQIGG